MGSTSTPLQDTPAVRGQEKGEHSLPLLLGERGSSAWTACRFIPALPGVRTGIPGWALAGGAQAGLRGRFCTHSWFTGEGGKQVRSLVADPLLEAGRNLTRPHQKDKEKGEEGGEKVTLNKHTPGIFPWLNYFHPAYGIVCLFVLP